MSRLRLHFSREAARELEEALAWWKANRPAAPSALKEELRRGFELIRTQPAAGVQDPNVKAGDVKAGGVRRLSLSGVRYNLYYSVSPDGSAIEVLSLWHSSRGTGPNI